MDQWRVFIETIARDKKRQNFPEIFTEFQNFRSQYRLTLVSDCAASVAESMSLSIKFYGNKWLFPDSTRQSDWASLEARDCYRANAKEMGRRMGRGAVLLLPTLLDLNLNFDWVATAKYDVQGAGYVARLDE
jgi:hypothetical protein